MARTWAQTLSELKAREGGAKFTNHPSDRGGPTKYGVTAAALGDFRRLGRAATAAEVQALTEAEADRLYTQEHWTGTGIDRVAAILPALAERLLDISVNMGPSVPGRLLQRSLNVMNRQQRDYLDLYPVDGRIGPKTLEALQSFLRVRGDRGAAVLLEAVQSLQGARYVELAELRAPNEDFVFGWFANRVMLGE